MATVTSQSPDYAPKQYGPYTGAAPDFVSIGEYLDIVNDPNYTNQILSKFKQDLDIMPMLLAAGREFPINRDNDIFHFEETRRYVSGDATTGGAIAPTDTGSITFTDADHKVRDEDDIRIIADGKSIIAHVTSTTSTTFVAVPKDAQWGATVGSGASVPYHVFGNEFGKGTNQPTEYLIDNIERKETKIGIMKDRFTMTGSQMTDHSRVTLPDGRTAFIYYSEQEGYKRFLAYKEMKLVYDVEANNTNLSTLQGNKGLIRSIEEEGNVMSGYIDTLDQMDDLVNVLDAQGGEASYALAANTKQFLRLQNMLAGTGGDITYGMFDNDESGQKTLGLGFKGFTRAGYDFFLKKAAFLNNPQIGGLGNIHKAFLIPQGSERDPQTGNEIPNLSILYKELNGYSRKMETQMTGFAGNVKGDPSGFDGVNVDYRSECGLRTAAMNKFVLVK